LVVQSPCGIRPGLETVCDSAGYKLSRFVAQEKREASAALVPVVEETSILVQGNKNN